MKFRSRENYAQIYASYKQGFNLGLDGAIFLREETTRELFNAPRIGTQGSSLGDTGASEDISGGTNTTFKIAVDSGAQVVVTLTVAGLNTGLLIAAALETAINAALLAAGQDARVWVEFDTDHYNVYSQYTGLTSSVVIADGDTNDVAADLLLGTANGGVEAVGADDQDFLLYTTGGPTYSQPVESNTHRSGRFHSGIIKKKKVAEFSLNTFVNMSGNAGASIDNTVSLLWESLLGTKEVVAGVSINFRQGLPSKYMTLVRASTIFGEYYVGAYVKNMDLEFPGDGPATCAWSGKAATRSIAGIASVVAPVAASASLSVEAGQAKRYTAGARVMVVSTDGRTILAGVDGALSIVSSDTDTDAIVLSAPVTSPGNSYLVPWNPGAVQQTGRDNIYTDLEGSFKLNAGGTQIDVNSISLSIANDHNDLDGYFGRDRNQGFVAGQRATMTLTTGFDLSNENFGDVVQSEKFEGYTPVIVLGAVSGRRLEISAKRWIPSVPVIDLPENGPTPMTLEGMLFPTAPGTRDPILVRWL